VSHPAISVRGNAVTIRVKVHPRAKKDAITGVVGDALKLSLTSPPVDGKANEACVRFIAELVGVQRSAVTIISGESSRNKVIQIANVSIAQVEAALTEAAHLQ
jgi:uncharacterized protein